MRVLICDDDDLMAAALHDQMAILGYEVQIASSGYDAIRLLTADRFDVVLSDYWMLDGDGGMLAHLCESWGVTCVVVTGHLVSNVEHFTPKDTIIVEKALLPNLLANHWLRALVDRNKSA